MNRYDEIVYALDDVIQSLIRLRNTIHNGRDSQAPFSSKYHIGELVYADYIGENVIIEDVYFDDGWKYKFHGPSAVSDNDYYSTYPEEALEPAHKEGC